MNGVFEMVNRDWIWFLYVRFEEHLQFIRKFPCADALFDDESQE